MNKESTVAKERNHFLPKVMLVLVLIGIGYVGYLWHLTYSGYCFEKKRYLTDEEFIQAAVRYSAYEMNIDGSAESIRTFHEKHPKCCSVHHNSTVESSWFENLLGFYYVVVELNYELRPKVSAITRTRFYSQYVQVTACGKRGNMYGEGTETLKDAIQFNKLTR